MLHDAAGIIHELLRSFPRCLRCRQPATRVAKPRAIIIGDHPQFCDRCEVPPEWTVDDLPEAEVIRAANHYLDTNAMKTSAGITLVPCAPYPEHATFKPIGLHCPMCNTGKCWRRYLSWEKASGITLNEDEHPEKVDGDHEKLWRAVVKLGADSTDEPAARTSDLHDFMEKGRKVGDPLGLGNPEKP